MSLTFVTIYQLFLILLCLASLQTITLLTLRFLLLFNCDRFKRCRLGDESLTESYTIPAVLFSYLTVSLLKA